MRRFVAAASVLSFAGCASYMPISAEESCASRGMRLSGISTSTGQADAYNWNSGTTVVTSSEESISCLVPETAEQTERINYLRPIAAAKEEFNSDVHKQRIWTALGYCLYIAPGVFLTFHYKDINQPKIERINSLLNADQVRAPSSQK